MRTDLTQEENEIIEYIESGNAKSITDIENEILKYTNMAKQCTTKKNINKLLPKYV